MKEFVGKSCGEMHGSIAAPLPLASLSVLKKPTREFLFVQSCPSDNSATAKLIKSLLVKASVEQKIILVTKNVLETHPARADECTSQGDAWECLGQNVFPELNVSFSLYFSLLGSNLN